MLRDLSHRVSYGTRHRDGQMTRKKTKERASFCLGPTVTDDVLGLAPGPAKWEQPKSPQRYAALGNEKVVVATTAGPQKLMCNAENLHVLASALCLSCACSTPQPTFSRSSLM